MDDIPEQECSCREQQIKNLSPEGLAKCLERELEETVEGLDFLTRKSEAIKASIAKLRQP